MAAGYKSLLGHWLGGISIPSTTLGVSVGDTLNNWDDNELLRLAYLLGTGDDANNFAEEVYASFKDYFLGVTDDADNLADAVSILLAVVLTLTVADDMDNLSDAITIEVEVFEISGIVMILVGVNIGVS